MDVLDVHRGRMSWRRLRVLIQHLPPESATMTAIRNAMPEDERDRLVEEAEPERGRWSQVEHLLATIADRVARLEYVTILAHSGGKGGGEPPDPIRRPGVEAKRPARKRQRLTEEGAERLFQLIHGGAEGA